MRIDQDGFLQRLLSDGPAADRAQQMRLYGWLVGDWRMDCTLFLDEGRVQQGAGEIHFRWALQGRAIQDVWILPGVFYGTTLRVYDAGLDAWHIIWSDPLRPYYARQIGRAQGQDIVQMGKDDDGTPTRWSFSEITPDSFRWRGERASDGGTTWRLQAEFLARRTGAP
ncbi:hypothetical protein [Pseudorhodoplanes sp.]|uniref:hypothetical protein n=1 Tax=Pseudorhodoplanes sp. TaxID=1934341 RepID=UPI00391AA917